MIVYRKQYKSKMRNQPQWIDGIYFPSKKEGRRYLELRMLEKSKEITDLRVHFRHHIEIGKHHITIYEDDFSYWKDGRFIIEDVKGRKSGPAYEMFRIKKRLMEAVNDLIITEI